MCRKNFDDILEGLKNGEMIIYPTDTLYALGVDIYNEDAVRRVYRVKRRPLNDPLPVAVASIKDAGEIGFLNYEAKVLAERFLPGKLTLIVFKKKCVSRTVTGGLDKIAIRIPDNKKTLRLLSTFGPLTATSANVHGEKTPSSIPGVLKLFKNEKIYACIDDGILTGMPSTIVDVTGSEPRILRVGEIKPEDVMDAVKK